MPVDPLKDRAILVVHGVQTSSDAELNQDKLIKELIDNRIGSIPLRFSTSLYRYENINDEALRKFKLLLNLLAINPVGKIIADNVLEMVGDVVIALRNSSTAAKIRSGLRDAILGIFQREAPCYIVAHSLGSIYTFDVLNRLMRDDDYFDRASRKTWPVQGLITIGSPIGLDMFRVPGRKSVAYLGEGHKWFRWHNYYDLTDPVVSGNIFGQQLQGYTIAENFLKQSLKQGWVIRDRQVDTGKGWLMAHVAYWENPVVGDGLVDMITN
jgi:hypothetical protein